MKEEKQHPVKITGFFMGIHPVSQAQWQAVMGDSNPSKFKEPDLPVEQVSHDAAVKFLTRLNELNKDMDRVFDLPTEAEWEYACRAGTTTAYAFGDTLSSSQANFDSRHGITTTGAGRFPANAWGLFDMHGNVWEWCKDWYAADYYQQSPASDPPGPLKGTFRVFRGGSWYSDACNCRSARRSASTPDNRSVNIGFRVVGRLSASTP